MGHKRVILKLRNYSATFLHFSSFLHSRGSLSPTFLSWVLFFFFPTDTAEWRRSSTFTSCFVSEEMNVKEWHKSNRGHGSTWRARSAIFVTIFQNDSVAPAAVSHSKALLSCANLRKWCTFWLAADQIRAQSGSPNHCIVDSSFCHSAFPAEALKAGPSRIKPFKKF